MAMSMNISCSSRMLLSSLMMSLWRASMSFRACFVLFVSTMICRRNLSTRAFQAQMLPDRRLLKKAGKRQHTSCGRGNSDSDTVRNGPFRCHYRPVRNWASIYLKAFAKIAPIKEVQAYTARSKPIKHGGVCNYIEFLDPLLANVK